MRHRRVRFKRFGSPILINVEKLLMEEAKFHARNKGISTQEWIREAMKAQAAVDSEMDEAALAVWRAEAKVRLEEGKLRRRDGRSRVGGVVDAGFVKVAKLGDVGKQSTMEVSDGEAKQQEAGEGGGAQVCGVAVKAEGAGQGDEAGGVREVGEGGGYPSIPRLLAGLVK